MENEKKESGEWVDETKPEAKPTKAESKQAATPVSETKGSKKVKGKKKAKTAKKSTKKAAVKAKPKAKKKAKAVKAKGKSKKTKAKRYAAANGKITVNFKIEPREAKAIKEKARKLCNGNVTQMVRMAVLAWKPNRAKLGEVRASTRA